MGMKNNSRMKLSGGVDPYLFANVFSENGNLFLINGVTKSGKVK